MKTTFSYFPGMFENKLEAKCYFKKTEVRLEAIKSAFLPH